MENKHDWWGGGESVWIQLLHTIMLCITIKQNLMTKLCRESGTAGRPWQYYCKESKSFKELPQPLNLLIHTLCISKVTLEFLYSMNPSLKVLCMWIPVKRYTFIIASNNTFEVKQNFQAVDCKVHIKIKMHRTWLMDLILKLD